MSGLAWFGGALDLAAAATELAAQWLIQSTLIIVVGLCVAAFIRKRNPALLSAVYHTTLLTALLCPLVAQMLSQAGLTFIAIKLPDVREETFEIVPAPPVVEPAPAPSVPQPDPEQSALLDAEASQETAPHLAPPFSQTEGYPSAPLEMSQLPTPQPQVAATPPAPSVSPAPAAPTVRRTVSTRPFVAALFLSVPVVWGLVTFTLLGRLLVDHLQLARLRRKAEPVDAETFQMCETAARRMQVTMPRLLRTPLVTSPCLSGVLRPMILLPEEIESAALPSVLVHELAHRKRGDCFWNLLRHVGTALLWPQPLLWKLARQMEAAAEDVCDDYVVQFGECRVAYAQALLAIAERNLLPASEAAVSLVTFRSLLGQRVQRILDQSRRLSLTVGLAALMLVAAGGASAALVAGLLGPANRFSVAAAADSTGATRNEKPTDEASEPVESSAPVEAAPASPDEDLVTVRGTVLDPEGKPHIGARVLALGRIGKAGPLVETRSDQQGEFAVQFSKSLATGESPDGWRTTTLLAAADGFAPGWISCRELIADNQATLKLAPEAAIEGRIVDLEGRPHAGATLHVRAVSRSSTGDVTPWLDTLRGGAVYSKPHANRPESTLGKAASDLFATTTTDADGRFRIAGLGPQTFVRLQLTGGGVATADLNVVTVPGEPIVTRFGNPEPFFERDVTLFGAKFQYAAEPSQPIAGRVVDAQTGKPIAGVRLIARHFAGKKTKEYEPEIAISDADGAYRIHGMPRGEGNQLLVQAAAGSAYFAKLVDVPVGSGLEPTRLEVTLQPGVLIRGRITNKSSGGPVRAEVQYVPWPDNPALQSAEFQPHRDQEVIGQTKDDGSFEVVGLPGTGLLRIDAQGEPFPAGQGLAALGSLPGNAFRGLTGGVGISPSDPTAIHKLDIPLDATEITADVALDAGERVAIEVVDAAGVPVSGLDVQGIGPVSNPGHERDWPGKFDVLALKPNEKRWVLVHHPGRKLGRAVQITLPVGEQPLRVVLGRCATVEARLLDGNGDPIRDAYVDVSIPHPDSWGMNLTESRTDKDGRYRSDAILPGASYDIAMAAVQTNWQPLAKQLAVAEGEIIDLGEFDVTSENRPEPKRVSAGTVTSPSSGHDRAESVPSKAPVDSDPLVLRGVVLDPQGKPAAGVRVQAFAVDVSEMFRDSGDGWKDASPPDFTTDAAGRFVVDLGKSRASYANWPREYPAAFVVAAAPGSGPAWLKFDQANIDKEHTLRLAADQPISARIVNLEGQPIAGVLVEVQTIETNSQDDQTEWLAALRGGASYRSAVKQRGTLNQLGFTGRWGLERRKYVDIRGTTDADGRVQLAGVGRGRLANLTISGPRVVTTNAVAIALPMEPIDVDTNGTFQPPIFHGAEFTLAVESSSPIAGIVRDADSGQPLAGVRVVSNKMAGTNHVQNYLISTFSGADGRYRLDGMPSGRGNNVLAMPTADQPYLLREFDVPAGQPLQDVHLDLDLHRGVWIEGQVRDVATKEPIRGQLCYLPWPDHPRLDELPEFTRGSLAGPEDHYHTDAEGRYRLVGLAGRGLVEFRRQMNFNSGRSYPIGQGVEQIADLPSDEKFRRITQFFSPRSAFIVGVKEVNAAEQGTTTADLELREGDRITLRLLDPAGHEVAGARVRGLMPPAQSYPFDNLGATVEVAGLSPGEKRRVVVVHPERRLGKGFEVSVAASGKGPLDVRLEPLATITGKLHRDGDPVKDAVIRMTYSAGPNFVEWLECATDAEGRFTHDHVPPGTEFSINCELHSPKFTVDTVAKKLTASGGETIDFGEIDLSKKERPEPKRTPAKAVTDAAAESASEAAAPMVIRGSVSDESGKPLAGASVQFVRASKAGWPKDNKVLIETTDGEGRFAFSLPPGIDSADGKPWPVYGFITSLDGFGMDLFEYGEDRSGSEPAIRLKRVSPIEGRIVNLEGQALPGVRVELEGISVNSTDDLTAWIDGIRKGMSDAEMEDAWKPDFGFGTALDKDAHKTETDADGRFRVTGAAPHQLITLKVSGASIVPARIQIANLPMNALPYERSWRSDVYGSTLFGAKFEFAAEPSQRIEGVVKDASTGNAIAGIRVASWKLAGTNLAANDLVASVSDDSGRYRLDGMPKGEGNVIVAESTGDVPYLTREFEVPAGREFEAISLDLPLHRGVTIRGQVRDAASGDPLKGRVIYLPWPDNPRIEGLPEFTSRRLMGDKQIDNVDKAGRFTVVGLPGRGILTIRRLESKNYPIGQGFDKLRDPIDKDAFDRISQLYTPDATNTEAIVDIEIADDATQAEATFSLTSGDNVRLTAVDPAGKPVTVSHAFGAQPGIWGIHSSPRNSDVDVTGLRDDTRTVALMSVKHGLGAIAEIKVGDGKPARKVVLQPLATITGRLLNKDGEPMAGSPIIVQSVDEQRTLRLDNVLSDRAGRFEAQIISAPFGYRVFSPNIRGHFADDLKVAPGETVDFGTIASGAERPPIKRVPANAGGTSETAVVTSTDTTAVAARPGPAPQDSTDTFHFTGKVVDADGNPVDGASILVSYYTTAPLNRLPRALSAALAVSQADGTFAFSMRKDEFDTATTDFPWEGAHLVAQKAGWGLGWSHVAANDASGQIREAVWSKSRQQTAELKEKLTDSTIRLVADDVPIEGRVINLEGQPVAGALIRIIEVHANRANNLDAWQKVAESKRGDYYASRETVADGFHGFYLEEQLQKLLPAVTSDADGRFRITGVGRERIVHLQIEPPGFETRQVFTRTRLGPTFELSQQVDRPQWRKVVYYGAEFSHVVAPSQPLVGIVRDKDSGKPLADVIVRSYSLAGEAVSGWSKGYIRTKTDSEGRYELEGLPIGENRVIAQAPLSEPYLCINSRVETYNDRPTSLDIGLKRGVWIRGQVTDADSGLPIRGRIEYFVFNNNPNRKPAGELLRIEDPFYNTGADGKFSVVGLPGRGLISFMAFGQDDIYPRGAGADKIEGGRADGQSEMFDTSPHYATVPNAHAFVEVNPSESDSSIDISIELDAGSKIAGKVEDPEGNSLAGFEYVGQKAMRWFQSSPSADFVVRHLKPGEKRRLLFYHAARGLAGSLVVSGEDTGPLSVRLEPAGTIRGRIVDSSGLPIVDAGLYTGKVTDDLGLGANVFPGTQKIRTDDDGRFTVKGLAPGIKYSAESDHQGNYLGTVFANVSIGVGETRDLGDVTPQIENKVTTTPQVPATKTVEPSKTEKAAFEFTGKVMDADGKPRAGAKLYLLPDALSVADPTSVGETAADGTFRFSLDREPFSKGAFPEAWVTAKLLANAGGRGPGWALLASFETSGELLKRLPPHPNLSERTADVAKDAALHLVADDVPIRGRVVDLEGKPVVGARVSVLEISGSPDGKLDAWIEAMQDKATALEGSSHIAVSTGYNVQRQLGGFFPDAKTDGDGRFELKGIGRERLVWLQIEGPQIETRLFHARTREGQANTVADPRWPKIEPRVYYGATFEFVIGPTRPIRGIVRDVDSGAPLPGVTVYAYRLANGWLQPWPNVTFFAQTDSEGRYTLTGLPIGKNKIVAIGPGDEPYLALEQAAEVKPAAEQVAVDFKLKRGVWIRGRVTDAATQKPLSAALEYHVFLDNPQHIQAEGLADAYVRRAEADGDGRFRIAGLPGRGIISARTNRFADFPAGAGAEAIEGREYSDEMISFRTEPSFSWATNYNAVAAVTPGPDGSNAECNFALVPAKVVSGSVLDPDDKPLPGVAIYGAVTASVWQPLADANFSVKGLTAGKPRYIQFYHAGRNLAASHLVKGDEQGPLTVKLVPAGTLIGRVLDEQGNVPTNLRIVSRDDVEQRGVIPGKYAYDIDVEGRFKIEGIPPGVSYDIGAYVAEVGLRQLAENVQVASGEVKDLGDLTVREPERKPKAATATKVAAKNVAMTDSAATLEFTGKVLDPEGKPRADAKVALLYYNGKQSVLSPPTTTSNDGAFLLHVAHDELAPQDAHWATLVVTDSAQGASWDRAAPFESSGSLLKLLESHYRYDEFVARSKDRTLRLAAADVPISGRVINLEGQGVAGARVRVRTICANPTGSLDAWLKAAESGEFELDQLWKHVPESIGGQISGQAIGHLLPEVVADADGRFKLTGVGRDRLVELLISADGLETCPVYVRTRTGETLQLPKDATDPDAGSETCYGPSFDYALAPSRPIVGVVRDVDSGQPIAGIPIVPELLAGGRGGSTISNDYLQTTTDAAGRYRLEGLPIGAGKIAAVPPRDVPYVAAALEVGPDPAKEQTTLDFQLKRGIWIRGRVTDAQSGQPVRGRVEYFVFNSNPHLNDAPGLTDVISYHGWVQDDGSYQVVGLPGPGLISMQVNEGTSIERYPRGAGADAIEGAGEGLQKVFRTSPYMLAPVDAHYVARIEPEPTADAIEHNIRLEAGQTFAGVVYDPEGQPLAGAKCRGLTNIGTWSDLKTEAFGVRHLKSGEKRRLYFHHPARELAASIEVSGEEKSPLAVKFVLAGTIKGRLFLEDGDPAARVRLWQTSAHEGREPRGILPGGQQHLTDDDGRFAISGIIPELYYSIRASRGSNSLGTAIENVVVTAGETKDLGDLTIHQPSEQTVSTPATKTDTDALEFTGKVLDPEGKPKAGAKVTLLYFAGGEATTAAHASTAADGAFVLRLARADLKDGQLKWANMVATAEGCGFAWESAAVFETSGELLKNFESHPWHSKYVNLSKDRTLRLVEDLTISGRVVNLEGQGVSGASVHARRINDNHAEGLDPWQKKLESGNLGFEQAWSLLPEMITTASRHAGTSELFPPIVTDSEGRFQMKGLGRNRLVSLDIAGAGLESQSIWVRTQTGDAQEFANDASERKGKKGILYGSQFDYAAAPSRPVEGVVRDADSGQPLAGIRVNSATTDGEGRYRLEGLRIGENVVTAKPPEDQPYLPAELEMEIDPIKDVTLLDFQLKRGIWIRGRVSDSKTDKPIRGNIQYFAFSDNPLVKSVPGLMRAIVSSHVDADGRFQVVGLPGHGLVTLLASNADDKYPRGAGSDRIAGEGDGGQKMFRTSPYLAVALNAHHLAEVNLDAAVDSIEHNIELIAGSQRPGRVLDPEGNPLAGVQCAGASLSWEDLETDAFIIRNLEPGQKRRLHFYHEARQLAGSIEVSGDDTDPVVVTLQPAGTIKGRVLFENGDPADRVELGSGYGRQRDQSPRGIFPKGHHLTDHDGRFTIAGLAPGLHYTVSVNRGSYILGTAAQDVTFTGDETRDLGDLTIPTPQD